MDDIERIAKRCKIALGSWVEVCKGHLDNWRWVDDTAVALAEATSAGGDWLLTDSQAVPTCAISFISTQGGTSMGAEEVPVLRRFRERCGYCGKSHGTGSQPTG